MTGKRPALASVNDEKVAGVPVRRYLPNDAKPGRIPVAVAEEVGFEPTVGLHPRRFSRPVR